MNPETQLQRGYELLFERVKSISEDCTEDLSVSVLKALGIR